MVCSGSSLVVRFEILHGMIWERKFDSGFYLFKFNHSRCNFFDLMTV
ncbi:hypothetical protein ACHAXS_000630 [Conticribra weissflogii]